MGKDNKGLIIFLVGIIVLLTVLCVLLATGIIGFDKNTLNDDNQITEFDNQLDNQVAETKKTLFENITEIRNSDDSKENKARKMTILFNEIIGNTSEIECSLVDSGYVCNDYFYDTNLEKLIYGEKYFDLKTEVEVEYIQNYIMYLKYKELYDKNLISKDVLENTDDYCVGYSYDDDYFYFDYYTGTYNKLLWYAFDSRTGKCNLQNQEYSHSYQINRDDLTSKKIVK